MKKIKAIGFDMDYTLIRYNTQVYEQGAFDIVKKLLVEHKHYPEKILDLKFKPDFAIRGLVLDTIKGNLLKLSCFGKVKTAYHGTTPMDFATQQRLYRGFVIDISLPEFICIDTAFSMAHATLFAELISYKDSNPSIPLPSYGEICDDIGIYIDLIHRDGTLKDAVKTDIDKYILQDKKCVESLERLKSYGKQLFLITNSDYDYTQTLMNHCFNPYLKNHKTWTELFDLTVTLATKPRYFTENNRHLEVDVDTGLMKNITGPLKIGGIYQGGSANKLQKDFNLQGDEILYIGDHIFGDIVSLKRSCEWRTALVVEELAEELAAFKSGSKEQDAIDSLMKEKEKLENNLDELYAKEFEQGAQVGKEQVREGLNNISEIDSKIADAIKEYQKRFNPYWGEIMRAGQEESRFAGQVEKYACIYMSKIADLGDYSPRKYFRPARRPMAHE
jgi:HAD superfamily 5'-nucleotidase-like hydrolase